MLIKKHSLALLVATLVCLAPPALAEDVPDPKPDFSGSWELDPDLSDDVGEKLAEAARAASRSQGRRPPGGGRPSVGGRRPSTGGRPGDDLEPGQALAGLEQSLRILEISHEEPEMRISSAMPGSDYAQTLYTDGRAFERATFDGRRASAKAEWRRGDRLAVVYEGVGERSVEEIWELVADGSRVLVTTRVAAKGLAPAIELKRVYDRVEIVPWDVPE